MDKIEDLIRSKIEEERGLVAGDPGRAIDALWFTIKFLMGCKEMYTIRINKFGVFEPSFAQVNKGLKREFYKRRCGAKNREDIEALFKVRRRLIRTGRASKSYYLKREKKRSRNGEVGGKRTEMALEILQDRIARCRQARQEQA